MKMNTGLTIGILLIVILSTGFIFYKSNSHKQDQKVKKTKITENPYLGLRTQALNTTPEQLQIQISDERELFGIVMDWNIGKAIVTVTSFKTGDASLYMSTGQAFIGGFAHEEVSNAAKEFVMIGNKYLSKAVKTEKLDPTQLKKVDFYFLTKSGIYYLEEDLSLIENGQSDLGELFNAGNQVITEYRLITDNK